MRSKFLLSFALLASAPVARAQETQTPASPTFTRPRTVAATPTPAQTTQTVSPAQQPPSPQPATRQPAAAVPSAVPTQTPPQQTGAAASPQPAQSSAPVVVPVVPVAPLPLQPVEPLAPNKIRAQREEAQRAFKTRLTPQAMASPPLTFVTLAALDPEGSKLHLMTMPKDTLLQPGAEVTLSSSLGTPLRVRVVRPNYVNTAVVVSDLSGRQLMPLMIEYPIEKFGRYREMAYYTSAHPALLSPELVKTGQAYVRTMVDLAAARLKQKGINIAPEILDMAERLCLVEHVDHERFRKDSRRPLFEEVYALYALNELDTYRYSVSTAGAGGMVQMIPWTYQMLRQRYPAVGLNPDFVLGMRNHGNALEAMLLYIRDTWGELNLNPDVSDALLTGIATKQELIAAGYNSNPARLGSYIRRGGSAWRTLIPRETQMYLQIMQSFESLLPIKPRAGKEDKVKNAAAGEDGGTTGS
ncbi:MAG: hypothetical protein LC785_12460 [Acidobacteria bacterium]|nr:hypothetical protein [Acidobacteriota bacterium]MCA1642732.1 hypothetical protein [Acidobacteriota bacterium]